MMKVFILLMLFFFNCPIYAAAIYKWVDKEGNVHFSQTPPNLDDTKRVGSTAGKNEKFIVTPVGKCDTLEQLLVGDWRGKDKDTRIVFRFYNHRILFPGNEKDMTYFIDYAKQDQLQGGFWTTSGPEIKLKIKKIGAAAKKRPTIEKLMVAKIDYTNLVLLAGEEEFRLRRYSGSGNTPRCSKKQ
ncbi:MAG: DUF4124 domain-containing protein [Gammaproteobacteria bacterium]